MAYVSAEKRALDARASLVIDKSFPVGIDLSKESVEKNLKVFKRVIEMLASEAEECISSLEDSHLQYNPELFESSLKKIQVTTLETITIILALGITDILAPTHESFCCIIRSCELGLIALTELAHIRIEFRQAIEIKLLERLQHAIADNYCCSFAVSETAIIPNYNPDEWID